MNAEELIKPTPITEEIEVMGCWHSTDLQLVMEALLNNEFVIVEDFYATGLEVLATLKQFLSKKYTQKNFKEQRAFRKIFKEASNKLLIPIYNHKIDLKKSPEIGWFKILYPNDPHILLTFPEVQGLNSSWQWYINGIFIPPLKKKINPFYGTYFPTRFEHITLFDKWLTTDIGNKTSAIDVGIGSGVLSLLLLKHGFEHITGTDVNPNALMGMQKHTKNNKLELLYGDLFCSIQNPVDLIVFNPPWIPISDKTSNLDKAIYYDDTLFPRFFEQASKLLKPDGVLVIIFSNLAIITGNTDKNPIEEELKFNKRFAKQDLILGKVADASEKTKRNQTWRKEELVELWVLVPHPNPSPKERGNF